MGSHRVGALALPFRGLLAGVYIEPTEEAVAEARWARSSWVACCLLDAAAGYAVLEAGWPMWVAGGLLTRLVLCGGRTWLAPETLLPQLAVVVAYPAALAAGVGGLIPRRPS